MEVSGPMLKLTTATTVAAIGLGPLDAVSVYLFNVPMNVPFLAFLGAVLSFAYNDENPQDIKRGKLYFLIAANTLISTAAVAVLPQMFGWEWYNSKIEGSVALLFAASARFTIPLFLKSLPELVRKWFKIGEYKSNQTKHPTKEESSD